MTNSYTYICRWSISPINKLIICQDAGKERSSYIIWKTARSLFLLFGTIVVNKLEADILPTES